MITWIKNKYYEFRIDKDFFAYEKQCRLDRLDKSKRIFSIKSLVDEVNFIESKIEMESSKKYDGLIAKKRSNLNSEISFKNHKLEIYSYFIRFYKKELDKLYSKKERLFEKKKCAYERNQQLKLSISEAYEDKQNAYDEIDSYTDDIDEWYSKSKRSTYLFGNAGRELPKHSFFSQCFDDLESYKSDRDSAYDAVLEAKERILELKQEKSKVNQEIMTLKSQISCVIDEIKQVKKDREKMYSLKKSGYEKDVLRKEINIINKKIDKIKDDLKKSELNKREFVIAEKYRHGVMDLKSKIKDIEFKKRQFINDFSLKENQDKRRSDHRKNWLKKYNLYV